MSDRAEAIMKGAGAMKADLVADQQRVRARVRMRTIADTEQSRS